MASGGRVQDEVTGADDLTWSRSGISRNVWEFLGSLRYAGRVSLGSSWLPSGRTG